MLGFAVPSAHTPSGIPETVAALPRAHLAPLALSVAVILVVLAAERVSRKIPAVLIAVIGAIIVSRAADLAGHGVAMIGPIPRGLPPLAPPALGWHDAARLVGPAASRMGWWSPVRHHPLPR